MTKRGILKMKKVLLTAVFCLLLTACSSAKTTDAAETSASEVQTAESPEHNEIATPTPSPKPTPTATAKIEATKVPKGNAMAESEPTPSEKIQPTPISEVIPENEEPAETVVAEVIPTEAPVVDNPLDAPNETYLWDHPECTTFQGHPISDHFIDYLDKEYRNFCVVFSNDDPRCYFRPDFYPDTYKEENAAQLKAAGCNACLEMTGPNSYEWINSGYMWCGD